MEINKQTGAYTNPYMEKARQWFCSTPNKDMFMLGSQAICAVAEYLANQEGTTLWPKKSTRQNIVLIPTQNIASHKMGELRNISYERIVEVLGPPNMDDDPDKVTHSWGYMVGGEPVAIWDWHGYEWSYFGRYEVLCNLFGKKNVFVMDRGDN